MNRLIRQDELKHYGIKGMKWGKKKKEEPPKKDPSLDLSPLNILNRPKLPFPWAPNLPKNEPRTEQRDERKTRIVQELDDDIKNRVLSLDDIPRFDPSQETIEDAVDKINDAYLYNSVYSIDEELAKEYKLLTGSKDSVLAIKNFTNNCPSTTLSYEMRRRGYDVEAGVTGGASAFEIMETFDIPYMEYKKAQLKGKPFKSKAEIEKNIKAMGPGARGFCIMEWKESGYGHISSFEVNSKGEIIYIDAQPGITSNDNVLEGLRMTVKKTSPANYYEDSSSYFVIRVDNRKPNPKKIKRWLRKDDRIDPKEVKKAREEELKKD